MIHRDLLKQHLEWAEDRRLFPYEDTLGNLTIGVGRNLDGHGLSDSEVDFMLENDINRVELECARLPYWSTLCDARQMVVADMVFNLGMRRFKGFVRTNMALTVRDYDWAADEMKDSRWYRQTRRRAKKLVRIMRTGEWELTDGSSITVPSTTSRS